MNTKTHHKIRDLLFALAICFLLYPVDSFSFVITEFSVDPPWIEFSTDQDWILPETLVVDNEVYPVELGDNRPGIFLIDTTVIPELSLLSEGGTIELIYLLEKVSLTYGTQGPVPSPPPGYSASYPPMGKYEGFVVIGSPWTLDPTPTPGGENDVPPPVAGYSNIVINEVYTASGVSLQPFIELYNRGNRPVDISGWKLIVDDVLEFPVGTSISAGGFYLVPEDKDLLPLNSPANTVYLMNDRGWLIDRMGWSEECEGDPLGRVPDGYGHCFDGFDYFSSIDFWRCAQPTPGYPNVFDPVRIVAIDICGEDVHGFVGTKVLIGGTIQLLCAGIDIDGKTGPISSPSWEINTDAATVDSQGTLTGHAYGGRFLVTASYRGLTDQIYVTCGIFGTLMESTVWTLENSPYQIISTLNIPKGVDLVIEPGVEINCEDIWIDGTVTAIGEPDRQIIFTGGSGSGIHVLRTGSTFRWCRFVNSFQGIRFSRDSLDDPGLPVELSHCEIMGRQRALVISNDIMEVNVCNNLFVGDGNRHSRGVSIGWRIVGRFRNNIIRGFREGLRYEQSPDMNIFNNVFESCSRGIITFGVENLTSIHPNIHHNAFSDVDTLFAILGLSKQILRYRLSDDDYHNFSADPLFVEPLSFNSLLTAREPWGDYRLLAGSPCIDAGDPTIRDSDGSPSDIGRYSGPEYIVTDQTAVEEGETVPLVFALMPNHPNPFNPSTTISFTLPQDDQVLVSIYNVAGQKVETLYDDFMTAGNHSVVWDATDFPAGVYFYTITSGDFTKTMKMTLLK